MRWLVLTVAVMLMLVWPGIFVQTHVHFLVGAANQSGAGANVRVGLTKDRSPADDPATCPLCRELAQASHFLSPGTPGLSAPEAAIACLFLLLFTLWARQDRSHAWFGRGPPAYSLNQ